jgi:hypothetical protein
MARFGVGCSPSGGEVGSPQPRSPAAPPFPTEGRQKKSTDPPVHLLYLRPTYLPTDFFKNNTMQICLQTFHTESLLQNNRQKLSLFWVFLSDGRSKAQQNTFANKTTKKSKTDFFSLVVFIAFLGVSQRGESENTTKNIATPGCFCRCIFVFRVWGHGYYCQKQWPMSYEHAAVSHR